MTKAILYFASWCPDTQPFVDELIRLNIDYAARDIVDPVNFKAFLKLRDQHSAFDNAKQGGYIGIPALVLNNGRIVLNLAELKEVLG